MQHGIPAGLAAVDGGFDTAIPGCWRRRRCLLRLQEAGGRLSSVLRRWFCITAAALCADFGSSKSVTQAEAMVEGNGRKKYNARRTDRRGGRSTSDGLLRRRSMCARTNLSGHLERLLYKMYSPQPGLLHSLRRCQMGCSSHVLLTGLFGDGHSLAAASCRATFINSSLAGVFSLLRCAYPPFVLPLVRKLALLVSA